MEKTYLTSQIAELTKVHPNTVRLYEKWGFLPPIPRTPGGYRIYNDEHLWQMKLARIALPGPYPGGKKTVYKLVHLAAEKKYKEALCLAKLYLQEAQNELKEANHATKVLETWATKKYYKTKSFQWSRKETARRLNITVDTLRTWERNGLLAVDKNHLGHKIYRPQTIDRLRIIRLLRNARYRISSIYRMFMHFDHGEKSNLTEILNTPEPEVDLANATRRIFQTLPEHTIRAKKLIYYLSRK